MLVAINKPQSIIFIYSFQLDYEQQTENSVQTNKIILIGLMGCGKTSIGRMLSKRLGLTFVDADNEIEAAAGCSISDIFSLYGEKAFRDGERRVMERLLKGDSYVLATGGGAFLDLQTRELCKTSSVSIWLKADIDLLVKRTSSWKTRPLLKNGDPREIIEKLIEKRYPIYEQADIIVDTFDETLEKTTNRILETLKKHIDESK